MSSLSSRHLVTNSLKHAFVGREGGTVRISLKAVPAGENEELQLVVSDDGRGLSKGADTRATLGLEIVRGLVKQIAGRLLFQGERGVRAEVVFPRERVK